MAERGASIVADAVATSKRTGGCFCGKVRYEVLGPMRPIVICHCSQCRRSTGHVMAATAARRNDFHLISGIEPLQWFRSSNEARRGFCGECGSVLFWDGVGRDFISIAAGSLDDPNDFEIACHIYVSDKPSYDEIGDGAPQIADGNFVCEFSSWK